MTPADPAVRRLAMLASLFTSPTRSFLRAVRRGLGRAPEHAVDLGCGTGHSTRLVAGVLQPARTLGLDTSEPALQSARARTRAPGVAYAAHDVTRTPFPGGAPDVAYARFVLAHVTEPVRAARGWLGALRPDGVLLLDEGVRVDTGLEPLARYLEIVGALVASRAGPTGPTDVGRVVDEIASVAPVMLARDVAFAPPAHRVAAMYRANVDTWRDDPFVAANVGAAAVAWVERELDVLAASGTRDGVVWRLRQVAVGRPR